MPGGRDTRVLGSERDGHDLLLSDAAPLLFPAPLAVKKGMMNRNNVRTAGIGLHVNETPKHR